MEQVTQEDKLGFQRCHGCGLVYPLSSLTGTVGGYVLCERCVQKRERQRICLVAKQQKSQHSKGSKMLTTYVRCTGCNLLVDENFASVGAKKAVCDGCSRIPEGQKAARERMLAAGAFAAESVAAATRL